MKWKGDQAMLGSEKSPAQEMSPKHKQGGTCWCGKRHSVIKRTALMFQIFTDGEHVASVRYLADAAILLAACGHGVVRHGHRGIILWREGRERFSAADSYDEAATVMQTRFDAWLERAGKESPQL